MPKYVTLGILAHVDAGKTTLSECMMYHAGKLKSLGRVDKGNAFLDTNPMEKERGITIFSKQALLPFYREKTDEVSILATLLDTPGHVDFSAEMERTLSVLDAVILVISASSGVQSHTRTLKKLLDTYEIPYLVFVNKMDQVDATKEDILKHIQKELAGNYIDFTEKNDAFYESVATTEETLMEAYLNGELITDTQVAKLFTDRKIHPVCFGAALKDEGVSEFMGTLSWLLEAVEQNAASEDFGARVFKISFDEKGERLTHLRITSGVLKVKDSLEKEKINTIRLYDGVKFEQISEAKCGQVVAVTGLTASYPGQGIGSEEGERRPLLSPVISYELILEDGVEVNVALPKLQKLAEEQPDLSLSYEEDSRSIQISLMGMVQTEIIQKSILERFGYHVSFGEKKIIYKETIEDVVEGVGHFEPLRHYAEVHLLLEPTLPGEGLIFETDCREEILDKNWQRLIMTHLKERTHRGVLTGSAITDMKITVVSGRAHPKHTEGGDFRQATYRAIRQGLMQAKSRLLEPYYAFRLELPTECVGRAMTDLERLYARDFAPEVEGDKAVLVGTAPVSTLAGYGADVTAYTSGRGMLSLSVFGYGPCHNEDEVLAARAYDPLKDTRNTPDSVFCAHGSGEIVPWNEVHTRMHMPSVLHPTKELTEEQIRNRVKQNTVQEVSDFVSQEEISEIMQSTFYANSHENFIPHKGKNHHTTKDVKVTAGTSTVKSYQAPLPEYLLVDGYNVLHAWGNLAGISGDALDGLRRKLVEDLSEYQAIKGMQVMVVFDAYRLQNHAEEVAEEGGVKVVFTKTAQTADQFIERFTRLNAGKLRIRVVTSDGLEQIIVRGADALVTSSREFKLDLETTKKVFYEKYKVQ
ncbi:MAG: NYN domain-containing protein [Lachnospiraceae bacterium]|nr:NYN domain-containing protein [Lachnospiraceae bacterium]